MKKERKLELLQRQIDKIPSLIAQQHYPDEYKRWKLDTELYLKKIFGDDSSQLKKFLAIHYSPRFTTPSTNSSHYQDSYEHGLKNASHLLSSLYDEVDMFDEGENTQTLTPLDNVKNICNRFPLFVRQLSNRHNNRSSFSIDDEYDVQDLFHALLKMYFDDIRPEEWTPSYAGGSSRVDFLLKKEKIVIEIKMTRDGLKDAKVGEQLIVDMERYQTHPDCNTLVCFVYDPKHKLYNPTALENDLSGKRNKIDVTVIVSPQ